MWLRKQDDATLMPWQLRAAKSAVAKEQGEPVPAAITDLALNMENRQHAIDKYLYGPMNPDAPGDYWMRLADVWSVDVDTAASTRCGSCAAFNQKPETLSAIADGIGEQGYAVSDAADLGYCELFQFKCAASRSCSAWLTGGPLTDMTPMDDYMMKRLEKQECSCWEGYERVPGTTRCEPGSCRKQ